jgi:hypothetical protein
MRECKAEDVDVDGLPKSASRSKYDLDGGGGSVSLLIRISHKARCCPCPRCMAGVSAEASPAAGWEAAVSLMARMWPGVWLRLAPHPRLAQGALLLLRTHAGPCPRRTPSPQQRPHQQPGWEATVGSLG